VRGILILWPLLAIPWMPVTMLSGMAFDGGDTWYAWVFVWSMWTYLLFLTVAFLFRKKVPLLVLLPLLNVIGVCISGFRTPA
jgi:hypothetical protein